MKKHRTETRRAVAPMFARYMEGPAAHDDGLTAANLAQVVGAVTGFKPRIEDYTGPDKPPQPNSSTHNGDFDY